MFVLRSDLDPTEGTLQFYDSACVYTFNSLEFDNLQPSIFRSAPTNLPRREREPVSRQSPESREPEPEAELQPELAVRSHGGLPSDANPRSFLNARVGIFGS
jgi:hypothetical protein